MIDILTSRQRDNCLPEFSVDDEIVFQEDYFVVFIYDERNPIWVVHSLKPNRVATFECF